jgi:hypothetical protein
MQRSVKLAVVRPLYLSRFLFVAYFGAGVNRRRGFYFRLKVLVNAMAIWSRGLRISRQDFSQRPLNAVNRILHQLHLRVVKAAILMLHSPELDDLQRITDVVIQLNNRLHPLADEFATVPFIADILMEQKARNRSRQHVTENDKTPAGKALSDKKKILQHAQGKGHQTNCKRQQTRASCPKRLRVWRVVFHSLILAPVPPAEASLFRPRWPQVNKNNLRLDVSCARLLHRD